MSAWTERFGDWWRGLSPREQWMLRGLAVVIAGLVFWYGLLTPLNRTADAAQARHVEAQAALSTAQAVADSIERVRGMRGGRGGAGPPGEAIRSAAGAAGVVIAREQPETDGGVGVWTEPVAAKPLFAWLAALRSQHGLGVRLVEIRRAEQDRLLEVRAVFSGASP